MHRHILSGMCPSRGFPRPAVLPSSRAFSCSDDGPRLLDSAPLSQGGPGRSGAATFIDVCHDSVHTCQFQGLVVAAWLIGCTVFAATLYIKATTRPEASIEPADQSDHRRRDRLAPVLLVLAVVSIVAGYVVGYRMMAFEPTCSSSALAQRIRKGHSLFRTAELHVYRYWLSRDLTISERT